MTMKIDVDWDLCVGHGQCEFVAPDVFTVNDEGVLELDETPPESERVRVEQAIRRCPVRALTLGAAPAAAVPAAAAAGGSPELLVLHALRIRGFASAEAVAASTGLPLGDVTTGLQQLEAAGHAKFREGRITGFALTGPGRERHGELRDAALTPELREAMAAAHHDFLEPNRAFKQLTTDWQNREPGNGEEALIERLDTIHTTVEGVLATAAKGAARFAVYGPRLAAALQRLRDGDASAFARPMSESYHDVWMELHEDLLATTGAERTEADE